MNQILIELVRLYLEREGYRVVGIACGQDALSEQATLHSDLIVLDLMLPDIDGFEVCRQIRAKSSVPILMLTARKEDVDKIVGLELGADDYLTKPFNPRELVARVKAILRRYQAGLKPAEVIDIADLHIDLSRHEVTSGGRPVPLRAKEFGLLVALAQNKGIVLSRDRLMELVWGYDYYGETRTIDVHVNHLRSKITGSGVDIETLRGTGYKMVLTRGTE
jgi:two-component system alkaline phosphatase synthesis response regulator PhoP